MPLSIDTTDPISVALEEINDANGDPLDIVILFIPYDIISVDNKLSPFRNVPPDNPLSESKYFTYIVVSET